MECDKCTLNSAPQVEGSGDVRSAKYVVVGEVPGDQEVKRGVPFVGMSGQRLNKYLTLAGIDAGDCYMTYVVKCQPLNNKSPGKKVIGWCREYLEEELAEMREDATIITLGSVALRWFTNKTLDDVHGCRVVEGVYNFVPMYHPAAGFYNVGVQARMVADWTHFPHSSVDVEDDKYKLVEAMSHEGKVIGVDTETTVRGELLCVAVSEEAGRAEGMLYEKEGKTFTPSWSGGDNNIYVFHNYAFDIPVLQRCGVEMEVEDCVDTMLAAYALGYSQIGLHRLSAQVLGKELRHWNEAKDVEDLAMICCSHADATRRLWEEFEPKLPAFYWDIDLPLSNVLIAMKKRGIKIDRCVVERREEELRTQIEGFSFPFNPASLPNLRSYVFEYLGVKASKWTDTGAAAVDKGVLEGIQDSVVQDILVWKKLSKEYSTYVANYLSGMDGLDRIHPTFIQTRQPKREGEGTVGQEEGTGTRRLSCKNPNVQNITKGPLRNMLVADAGNVWISADYSQLELRVFAAIWGAKSMLDVFERGGDIHEETRVACGFPPNEYGRRDAKIMNFLMLFEGSVGMIWETFGWPLGVCQRVYDGYFKKYPEILDYWEEQKFLARRDKSVATWFGYVRQLPGMLSGNKMDVAVAYRQAINTPVQGTAADVVKSGMVFVGAEEPMVMQVHDEMGFDYPEKRAVEFGHYLLESLPGVVEIERLKFPVEVEVGRSYGELESLESWEKKRKRRNTACH